MWIFFYKSHNILVSAPKILIYPNLWTFFHASCVKRSTYYVDLYIPSLHVRPEDGATHVLIFTETLSVNGSLHSKAVLQIDATNSRFELFPFRLEV
jgi:hypothetical protein